MGKSVSVTMGRGSLNHNNRVFKTNNVDPTLSVQNVVFQQKSLENAYTEIFGEALQRYNDKQKRSDRKIPDYLEHVRQSGNGEKPFYEIVAQVGDRYDTGIQTADAATAKEVLTRYYHEFVERNPKMRVFNAIIHMDEFDGTPHLHIDFIPTATEQKRGLEIKNSMRQALEQQGFSYQNIPSKNEKIHISYPRRSKIGGGRWLDAERQALAATMKQFGIEHEEKGVRRENLSVAEYKACAEIIRKEVENTHSSEIEMREPTRAMRFAGVREGEVLVSRSSLESVRQENVSLRVESKIQKDALKKINSEKKVHDGFMQHLMKDFGDRERALDAEKIKYSIGTAEKYKELLRRYKELAVERDRFVVNCKKLAEGYKKLERSVEEKIETAVRQATQPLHSEIGHLKSQVRLFQDQLHAVCHVLHDVVRAVFTFGYRNKDKSPNPYCSDLTEDARYLLNAVEDTARNALHAANEPQLANGLDGMGLTRELVRAVDVQRPTVRERKREHEIGG